MHPNYPLDNDSSRSADQEKAVKVLSSLRMIQAILSKHKLGTEKDRKQFSGFLMSIQNYKVFGYDSLVIKLMSTPKLWSQAEMMIQLVLETKEDFVLKEESISLLYELVGTLKLA